MVSSVEYLSCRLCRPCGQTSRIGIMSLLPDLEDTAYWLLSRNLLMSFGYRITKSRYHGASRVLDVLGGLNAETGKPPCEE